MAEVDHKVIQDKDLTGQDLRRFLVEGGPAVHFLRCDLSGANLKETYLRGFRFTDCTAKATIFIGALLDESQWDGGGAPEADFRDTDAVESTYKSVDLYGTSWGGAVLTDARFEGCRLTGARLLKLQGLGFDIVRCKLAHAQMTSIDLRGRHLLGNDLQGANLSGADLRDTTYERTVLAGANLREARLDGADLTGAELGEITLETVQDLAGATLSLSQAQMLLSSMGLRVAL